MNDKTTTNLHSETKTEFHPRWRKNLDELAEKLSKRSKSGLHLCSIKYDRLFLFEKQEPRNYLYRVIHKKGLLTPIMLTGDDSPVVQKKKFSVFRRELPMEILIEENSGIAKIGNIVKIADHFDFQQMEEMEQWLGQKSNEGLHLQFYLDDGCYFQKGQAENREFLIYFNPDIVDFSQTLTELSKGGWQYIWGDGVEFYFFRALDDLSDEQRKIAKPDKIVEYGKMLKMGKKLTIWVNIFLFISILSLLLCPIALLSPHGFTQGVGGLSFRGIINAVFLLLFGIFAFYASIQFKRIFRDTNRKLREKMISLKDKGDHCS